MVTIIIFLFVILTFISLRISFYLSSYQDNRVNLSPILLFTLLQVSMVNIGLLISVIGDQNYYGQFLIILLSTFFINLGAFIIGKPKPIPISRTYNQSIFNKIILLVGYIMVVIILIFLLRDIIFYFIQFIKESISGNVIGAITILAESRRDFSFSGGGNGIVTEFKNVILVFLTIYICSTNFKWYFKSIIVAITILFLLSTGQRWPLFEALLVYIVFITYSKKVYFNKKKISFYGLIAYLFFFVISYFTPRFAMSENIVNNIILNFEAVNYRLFVSQNRTSLYIFDLIPNSLDFGWGKYILKDLSTLFPGYQEGFSSFIYKLTHSGKAGSASFSSLTGFYADFAYFAPIVSFAYGMLIQFYSKLIFLKSISHHRIIFHSFLVVAISTTSLGSIVGIITHGLLSSFLLFKLLSLCLKPKKYNSLL